MPSSTLNIMLRDVHSDDLPIFFEQQLDAEANHMAAFTRGNPEDRAAFDQHWAKILADPSLIKKTILLNHRVAGSVSKYKLMGNPEITYWIGKEYWGQGVATAALSLFLRSVSIRPIYAHTAKDNIGSGRVLTKCGFKTIGESKFFSKARGEEIDELEWRLDPCQLNLSMY